MSRFRHGIIALFIMLVTGFPTACGGGGSSGPSLGNGRSFFMGFTPFWASSTTVFGDWKFDWAKDADLVSLHADDFFGIPWSEFSKPAAQRTLAADWVKKWDDWFSAARATGHPVLVSLSPLAGRSRLTAEVDATTGAKKDNWDPVVVDSNSNASCYAFSSATMDSWTPAYIEYVKWISTTYHPEHIIIAIEANIQFYKCPAYKVGFIRFLNDVYQGVKAAGVGVPVFVSYDLEAMYGNGLSGSVSSCGATPINTCADARMSEAIAINSDAIGISTYPQNWFPRTESPPTDRFDRLRGHTTKPLWISETGWNVAQVRLDYTNSAQCNVAANMYFDATSATAVRQQQWMTDMLAAADRVHMAGIVWWLPRDYLDAATASTCPCDSALNANSADTCKQVATYQNATGNVAVNEFFYRVFANMGVQEKDGSARPALTNWRSALARTKL